MSRKLTPAQRKQIISDYKNGIQNEDYRVIDQGDGKYQVRRREDKFKIPPRPMTPPPPKLQKVEEEEDKEEKPPKDSPIRMSNEELLYKLSNLLQVPVQEPDETPDEHDHEEEAHEDDKEYFERAAVKNPWSRTPLRLF